MSATVSLIHTAAGATADLPLFALLRGVLGLTILAALLSFFKPLLTGVLRAAVLVVRPRRSKEQLAARRQMRDGQMLQKMINSSNDPSHAAELRAMASRA